MKIPNNRLFHLLAILTVAIWGTTFISTKILLIEGLAPAEIMFLRFLTAYVLIWFLSPRHFFAENLRDEMWLALAGVCGGSLYFQTENMALRYTLTSNVALIICTAPILTALVSRLFFHGRRIGRSLILGSLVALTGVALVVYNGRVVLNLHPLGDVLTFISALSWAFYTNIIKKLDGKYSTGFVTRKVFFYGLLTLLPVFLFEPFRLNGEMLSRPVVFGNLIFLGIIASLLCFLTWSNVVKRIGPVAANNYIYATPLVTMITSAMILSEPVTWASVGGAGMIISGVWLASRTNRPINFGGRNRGNK